MIQWTNTFQESSAQEKYFFPNWRSTWSSKLVFLSIILPYSNSLYPWYRSRNPLSHYSSKCLMDSTQMIKFRICKTTFLLNTCRWYLLYYRLHSNPNQESRWRGLLSVLISKPMRFFDKRYNVRFLCLARQWHSFEYILTLDVTVSKGYYHLTNWKTFSTLRRTLCGPWQYYTRTNN